ncbi:unnamed protein product, partial [Ectocarpus fasciculatus]
MDIDAIYGWAADCWRSVVKVLRHVLTGKGEIEHICAKGGYHNAQMSTEFSTSLYYSKQLKQPSHTIFSLKMFSVSGAVDVVVTRKGMSTKGPQQQVVVSNIGHCLHALKYFNTCADKIFTLKDTKFDCTAVSHMELLESFWACMRPDVQRVSIHAGGIASEDWGEVGFQGVDPSTDFRGMGLLGLYQLEYFARTRPTEAQAALANSKHPRRYYPFAATGINITSFVMDLVRTRRLHQDVFKTLEINSLHHACDAVEGPSSSPTLLEIGFNTTNDVYCEVFIEFDRLWAERDPTDVMAFPAIFSEVKGRLQ